MSYSIFISVLLFCFVFIYIAYFRLDPSFKLLLFLILGEIKSSYIIRPQRWKIEEIEELRRRCRKQAAIEWDNAIQAASKRLENPLQQEEIGDELRYFILNWYRTIGELPLFPDDELILPPPGLLGFPKGKNLVFHGGYLINYLILGWECDLLNHIYSSLITIFIANFVLKKIWRYSQSLENI